ncbi:MAG: tetratricopeptide repeat protein [Kiritimatiellae bacterium]|nr:tetratricopeptide repeat protein [Kiritimatiellia bacterium]
MHDFDSNTMLHNETRLLGNRVRRGICLGVVLYTICCGLSLAQETGDTLSTYYPMPSRRPVYLGASPFEPTVTRKEAALLQAASNRPTSETAEAIASLQSGVSKVSSPALDFAIGNMHVQNNDLSAAETHYVHALRKLPTFRAAQNNLARVYLARDKPQRAMSVFQGLIRDGQGDAQTYLLLAHALASLEQPLSAEGAYRQALILSPGSSQAMRGLARTFIAQERYREVLALTKEMQAHDPGDAELWTLRANAHIALEQHNAAIDAIETGRLLCHLPADLQMTLGELYMNRGQPREAAGAYIAGLRDGKGNAGRVLQAVHVFLLNDRVSEAAECLAAVTLTVETSPSIAQRATLLQAMLAEKRGETKEALVVYTALLEVTPLDGDVLLAVARLQIALGNHDLARVPFERAARLEGFESRGRILHAQMEVQQKRYAAAILLLEQAQVFDENQHVTRYLDQLRRLSRP